MSMCGSCDFNERANRVVLHLQSFSRVPIFFFSFFFTYSFSSESSITSTKNKVNFINEIIIFPHASSTSLENYLKSLFKHSSIFSHIAIKKKTHIQCYERHISKIRWHIPLNYPFCLLAINNYSFSNSRLSS